jgi:putative addiction module component (TIGR02574 family)
MNKSLLLDELMQLSAADRRDIAERLWESLDPNEPALAEDSAPLTDEQMQEVRRRLAEHQRDPSTAIPYEEVRAWLWSRRSR